jgi:adenine-specific DNA-methyltransferase
VSQSIADPEAAYSAAVSADHRRRWGQFWTPPPLAELMTAWIANNAACRTILDPAVGLGVFFRALHRAAPDRVFTLHGYDRDPAVLDHAGAALAAHGIDAQLTCDDYLLSDWERRYDGIVCNPPYIHFQSFECRATRLREVEARLGVALGGLTNIHALFLLKAIHQLAPGGRAAFLLPGDWLNADYGVAIKDALLRSGTLRYLLHFPADDLLFQNAITSSCVLLLARDAHADDGTFVDVTSDRVLGLAREIAAYPARTVGRTIAIGDLDPQRKWHGYLAPSPPTYRHMVPLATYGRVQRGIATGANAYFMFDREKQRRWGIADRDLLPCVAKATHAPDPFFTSGDHNRLCEAGKPVLLLNTASDDPAVAAYRAHGEALGIHTRYLLRQRRPWYAPEQRPPAPLLATTFSRSGVRWVRNEAGARNLTCFHRFYPNAATLPKLDLLCAFLLTSLARELMHEQRRPCGGGLAKWEPNDLNRALVIDLAVVDNRTAATIHELYDRYRTAVLTRRTDENAILLLDQLFRSLIA